MRDEENCRCGKDKGEMSGYLQSVDGLIPMVILCRVEDTSTGRKQATLKKGHINFKIIYLTCS